MKTKNHNILPEDHELAPELEWLLKSHQFSAVELAKGLVTSCYPQLVQWMTLNLADAQAAGLAALNTILRAATHAYSFPGKPSALIWVFRLGVGELRQVWRKQLWISLRKKLRLGRNLPSTRATFSGVH